MLFLVLAFVAGLLTVLAPCILPLLPIVIGTAEGKGRRISMRSLRVIASLSVSVVVFTFLLKGTTYFIGIPQSYWQYLSGTILILVGIAIAFPMAWARLPFLSRASAASNKAVGAGYMKHSSMGDVLVGAALGPVFTTCSPTYLLIVATVLPASLLVGSAYLLAFVLGLALALFCVAYFGERLTALLTRRFDRAETIKRVFGVLIVAVGVMVFTGFDKQLETSILNAGYGATISFENELIGKTGILETPVETNDTMNATQTQPQKLETITLAGGCFWCIEAALQNVEGVQSAISGYAGGTAEDATYLRVSTGDTQHREAVQIVYDPDVVSLPTILNTFWASIDPTDAGGQFADRGMQYTTAIYYHTKEQAAIAEASKKALAESGLLEGTIATQILPFTTFFEAEEYHQDYFLKASDHYARYKKGSGRADFIEETWARDAAKEYFKEQEMNSNTDQSRGEYEYTPEEIAQMLKNLDPLAYHVVAESGTESPFNNAYWDNKAEGIYVDVVTGKPLFSSTHKYDSGTGWPSFWRTIDDDSVTMHEDNSLSTTRTEIRSEGGHVGHVFDDGPVEEGGRRFCTNSASLRFVPKADMEKEGYAEYLYLFEEV